MDNKTIYDEYSIMLYLKKGNPKFALRERFFVAQDALKNEDIENINIYLLQHANHLDNLFYKNKFADNICACYTFEHCDSGFMENNYSFNKNLALNICHANQNLESWLDANKNQKNCTFLIKKVNVFNTKQEVIDEIVALTKLEYQYANKIASAKKINKKKVLKKFEYNNNQDMILYK